MDRLVWVSYFSTLCHSIGVDPAFAFTALVMGPILILVWWVSTKKEKQLDSKMYEIRTSELPENMEFYTKPTNYFVSSVLAIIGIFFLWHFDVFGVRESVNVRVGYVFVIGLSFAMQYVQNRYAHVPLVTLSKAGFKYGRIFHSWDAIGKVEVNSYKDGEYMTVTLKHGTQLGSIICFTRLGSIKQPWLAQYAEEYLLRFGSKE